MFGKTETGTAGAPRPPSGTRAGNGGSLSFIGREVTITGSIGGSGNLHVDGRIEGDVAASSVILGAEGHINGNIVADTAQIAGSVEGTVAAKSLVIEASARIIGDLSYDMVSIASGAQVDGRVKRLTRDGGDSQKLLAAD